MSCYALSHFFFLVSVRLSYTLYDLWFLTVSQSFVLSKFCFLICKQNNGPRLARSRSSHTANQ